VVVVTLGILQDKSQVSRKKPVGFFVREANLLKIELSRKY
jgi:hypothetical protein